MKNKDKKQIKTLEDHGKQLVKSSTEEESLILLKQKEIFEELTNERVDEIQNLSIQIDFTILVYFNDKSSLNTLLVLTVQ